MKFGSQILDKSVPEWKLNNIDYNRLKDAIRTATTFKPDKQANTDISLDPELCKLRSLFLSQFQNINMFVSLKIKEISTRLVSIESTIIKLQQRENLDDRVKKRQIGLVYSHLDNCNLELQRFSRYLIIQKIALKKLLKKFLKHYPYDHTLAEQFIESLKNTKELTNGHDGISFTKVDLDPYLLEVSLILDVLHDLEASTSSQFPANPPKPFPNEGVPPTSSRKSSTFSKKTEIGSTLEFDMAFLSKYNKLQSFLISQESITELKFLLVKLGFHIVDDEVMSSSKQIRSQTSGGATVQRDSLPRKNSLKSVKSFQDLQLTSKISAENDTNEAPPKNVTSQPCIDMLLLDSGTSPSFLDDPSANAHPNILIRGQEKDKCILMCHVGGLRSHIATDSIPSTKVLTSLNYWQDQDSQKSTHTDDSGSTSPLDRLCLEWIGTRNLKVIKPTITVKRTRFIMKNVTDDATTTYLIVLDEGILLNKENLFPHAILEIKKLSTDATLNNVGVKDSEVTIICEKILECKLLCYPILKSMTLWKLAYLVQSSKHVQTDLFNLLTADEDEKNLTNEDFFQLGKDKIFEMTSKKYKNAQEQGKRPSVVSVISSNSPQKPKIRYWNEFEDGDEAMDNNADGFYVYPDSETQSYDRGFVVFSKSFINSMFNLSEKFKRALGLSGTLGTLPSESSPLTSSIRSIQSHGSYQSTSSFSTSPTSKNDIRELLKYKQEYEDESESIYEYKHDQVVTFLYMFTLLVSCITSGISVGIVVSLFHLVDDDTELEGTGALIATIVVSLLISLLLSCTSLSLLFSRFKVAPWWHYVSCFLIFLLITCTVCYGIIELLM